MGGKPKGRGGRPPLNLRNIPDLKTLCRRYSPKITKELYRLALNGEAEGTRVAAIRELYDRGYGRPPQTVNVRRITSIQDLTDEELDVLAMEAERQGITIEGTSREVEPEKDEKK